MQTLATMQQKLNLQHAKTGEVNSTGAGARCRPVASSVKAKLALLDPTEMGTVAKNLEKTLRQAVTGHDAAIHEIVKVFQTHLAGLCPVGRPIGAFLFLGPTGSGRQQTVEAVADALLGSSTAIVRINCMDFQHSHDITKLIGTPRGYPTHRQTQALLTQDFLNQHHTNSMNLSVLLFDQVESAAAAFWNRLLGILDTGTLRLGDNRQVDFSRALIFMTSTISGAEMNSPFGRNTAKHDNILTRGWFVALPEQQKQAFSAYLRRAPVESRDAAPELTRLAWSSLAALAIAPLQDLLNLGAGARMNTPGRASGNWRWRITEDSLSLAGHAAAASTAPQLTEVTNESHTVTPQPRPEHLA